MILGIHPFLLLIKRKKSEEVLILIKKNGIILAKDEKNRFCFETGYEKYY